jgi:hypothetical protein
MPTIAGNSRVIYAAIQSAKGTPATTPTHKFVLTGDTNLDPGRNIIELPETDASSQQPDSVVVGSSPAGGWGGWLRPSEFAFLARACFGANADAGAGPYTHTATFTQTMPYLTCWDVIPGILCTQFVDTRIGVLGVSGEALAGVGYTVEAMALSAVLNATEPTLPAAASTEAALAYPGVWITVGGSHPGTHDAFTITVNRNLTMVRGDLGLASYDVVPGIIGVEGTFRRIFENDDAYNEFHGGSAAATVLTPTIFTESLLLQIGNAVGGVGTAEVRFTSTAMQYTQTTVPVNTDGTPVIMDRTFRTKRNATIANNLSCITKNALATSVTSPT